MTDRPSDRTPSPAPASPPCPGRDRGSAGGGATAVAGGGGAGLARLFEIVGRDQAEELRHRLLQDLADIGRGLAAARVSFDVADLSRQLHRLVGLAGCCGAMQLRDAARQAQQGCANVTGPDRGLLDTIMDELAALRRSITVQPPPRR